MKREIRYIDFSDILNRNIPDKYGHDGRLIAATVITPKQVLNIIPDKLKTKYHCEMLKRVFNEVYPHSPYEFKDFYILAIDYVISSIDEFEEDTAYICSPAYITFEQATYLKDVVDAIKQAGFAVGLIICDTYPGLDSKPKKLKAIFYDPSELSIVDNLGEHIIEIFANNNRIVDSIDIFKEESIISTDKIQKM